jgi:hypothetical protein
MEKQDLSSTTLLIVEKAKCQSQQYGFWNCKFLKQGVAAVQFCHEFGRKYEEYVSDVKVGELQSVTNEFGPDG